MTIRFQLDYKKQDEVYTMPEDHYHDYYEIYYLYSGERHYFLEDRIYQIHQGDLIFIPPNLVHKTAEGGTGSHERMLVYFSPEFLDDVGPGAESELLSCFNRKLKAMRLQASHQTFVENLLHRMRKEDRKKLPRWELYQKLLLTELLIFAFRNSAEQQEDYFYPEGLVHKKVHEVICFLRKHFHQQLTLKELAEIFFISPHYLSRVFKRVTGLTLVEYLNTIRIREAQRLLRESDSTILEIAQDVGFDSQTHFGRTFKKMTGLSPLKYRQSTRNLVQA